MIATICSKDYCETIYHNKYNHIEQLLLSIGTKRSSSNLANSDSTLIYTKLLLVTYRASSYRTGYCHLFYFLELFITDLKRFMTYV